MKYTAVHYSLRNEQYKHYAIALKVTQVTQVTQRQVTQVACHNKCRGQVCSVMHRLVKLILPKYNGKIWNSGIRRQKSNIDNNLAK